MSQRLGQGLLGLNLFHGRHPMKARSAAKIRRIGCAKECSWAGLEPVDTGEPSRTVRGESLLGKSDDVTSLDSTSGQARSRVGCADRVEDRVFDSVEWHWQD